MVANRTYTKEQETASNEVMQAACLRLLPVVEQMQTISLAGFDLVMNVQGIDYRLIIVKAHMVEDL